MREKFVIYRRPTKPKSAALPTAKKFAAAAVLGVLGVVGMHVLYAPAEPAASARSNQPQASDALKQLLPQAAAATSVALSANLAPAPEIDHEPAPGGVTPAENRAEVAAPLQGPENATQPAAAQRPVKAEKPVPPKQKVARAPRSNQYGAYAQSMYQDPYRANAARWDSSAQRPSGFFPF
jgi:hypothetical protein